jgi:hypothetical protein
MTDSKFTEATGTYTAANRRRDATTSVDPTAQAQAEKTKTTVLNDLAAHCHPNGLHLVAADEADTAGTARRWGSTIAKRLAAEVSRETRLHPLVSALNTDAESIELALKADSHAVGQAAEKPPPTGPKAAAFYPTRSGSTPHTEPRRQLSCV